MNTTNETIGLRVLHISPNHQCGNVKIHSNIDIAFSADINPATLAKNIVIFEDYNKIYKNINSLKDYSNYNTVKGSISYKDRILTYTPDEPFHTDSCYIVVLNDSIRDITGNQLVKKHVSVFYTESIASYPRCEIVTPKYGCITDEIPEFTWRNQCSASYIFQVSKSNDFELLLCDDIIPGNKIEEYIHYKPVFQAKEGIYHIRVKSDNGEWSDIHQIFIKEISDAVIAEEDTSELLYLQDFLDGLEEPLEILEYFPENESVNNNLKTNIIYVKIKGNIDKDLLKIDDCYVFGESFDDEHEEYAHETVDGKWTVVYDSYFDVTYIIFTPVNLEDTEELEFIETLRSGNLIQSVDGGIINEN